MAGHSQQRPRHAFTRAKEADRAVLHLTLPAADVERFHELAKRSALTLTDYAKALIKEGIVFQVEVTRVNATKGH